MIAPGCLKLSLRKVNSYQIEIYNKMRKDAQKEADWKQYCGKMLMWDYNKN